MEYKDIHKIRRRAEITPRSAADESIFEMLGINASALASLKDPKHSESIVFRAYCIGNFKPPTDAPICGSVAAPTSS